MKYRLNNKENLTNNFNLETGIDELPKVWPYNAEPILDPTYFSGAEKTLVPLTGRIIRSLYFNNFADSLAAVQHRIKDNVGNVIWIDANGVPTDCAITVPLKTIQAYTRLNTELYFAFASKTVTADFSASVTGYAFQTQIDIPSGFSGTPLSSNNFAASVTAHVIDNQDSGIWANQLNNVLSNLNQANFLSLSYAPDKSNPTKLNVWGKNITRSNPNLVSQDYNWQVSGNVDMLNILAGGTYFTGYSTKPKHPVFRTRFALSQEPLWHMSARTRSLQRVHIRSTLDWGDSKVKVGKIFPYTDVNETRGVAGGILTRDRVLNPDVVPNPVDVAISFSFNGYFFNTYLRDDLFERGPGYITKSGVFLRLNRHSTPIPKNLIAEGYDYNNYPWFEGYLLRFNAQPIDASDNALDGGFYKVDKKVGSWCIMKVRYEQFGGEHESYKRFWDLCHGAAFDVNAPLTVGVQAKAITSHPRLAFNPPGEYEVLAYNPVGEEFIPFIQRTGYETFTDVGSNMQYKFEIVGDTIKVYKRNLNVTTTWTTILTVVDPNPIYATPGALYTPSGLYSKGSIWADDRVNESGFVGNENELSLCNITEHTIFNNDSSKEVRLDALFYKIPGQDTTPTIS